ncbi:MAG: transcriptional repressor LexA [Calditrichota bacterium]
MTDRQRSILAFISADIESRGRPPTLREIGSHFGIGSTNGVRAALITLEQKGWIKRDPYSSRGIMLIKTSALPASVVRIPIVGRVAAGAPLLAEENIEGELLMDRCLFPSGDGFALRVKGSSMINAGISDGDIVLARPDLPLENGSIVVALIGEEATVKRFYPERDRVRLEPANEAFGPIIIERNTPGFRIVGRVVGLYRRY